MPSRKKPALVIFLIITAILLLVGFLALVSASSITGARVFSDTLHYVKEQYIIGLGAALVAGFIFYKIPHNFWRKTSFLWLGLCLILVLLAFIPQLTLAGTSAHRWLKIGQFSFQPSEFLRFFYIIFLAAWLAKNPLSNLRSFKKGILPFILILALISFPLIKQPATSMVALLWLSALTMYLVAGMRWKHLVILLVLILVFGSLFIFLGKGYRWERIKMILIPELANPDILQQSQQSLEGIGSGRLWGVGYFNSIKKYQYIPLGFSDFIFAIFAEENGFFLSLVLILLYLAFIGSGFSLALNASDLFSRYVILGLALSIGFQALVSIGVNIGLLPVTGLPLPFIAYGKSNLVIIAMSIGLILNTAKRKT
jgi:cell division protein FtsW